MQVPNQPAGPSVDVGSFWNGFVSSCTMPRARVRLWVT
jgi:hypothetical protein